MIQVKKNEGILTALKLPAETRFMGGYMCLESLIKNKAPLQATAIIEGIDIPMNVRSTLLNNEDFWSQIV